MVTSIVRQSVILKCVRQQSVLLGNYEFYYLAGLFVRCFGLELSEHMEPQKLSDKIQGELESLSPGDEREAYMIKLVRYFVPQENYDGQMRELFAWGASEEELWQIHTSRRENG